MEEVFCNVVNAVTLSCLRCPAMQKVCGSVLPSTSSGVHNTSLLLENTSSANGSHSNSGLPLPSMTSRLQTTSLLKQLCSLSSKFYKDKK